MTYDISSLTRRSSGPTAVFMGAGAAVADGLPSTWEMLATIRSYVLQYYDYRATTIDPTIFRSDPTKIFSEPILLPCFERFLEQNDVESLTRLITELSALRCKSPIAGQVFHRLTWAAAKSADLPQVGVFGQRKRLLEHFHSRSRRLFVMTTNWDTSLDTVLNEIIKRRQNGGLYYGLTDLTATDNSLHFYKLNGSPDWFVCSDCKIIRTAEDLRSDDNCPDDFDHLYYDMSCPNCGMHMDRAMVLPAESDAHHPLSIEQNPIDRERIDWDQLRLLSIHSLSITALMEAEKIIFIGYSLPEYDTAVRFILKTALDHNHFFARNEARITVIAKGPDGERTHESFKSLLGAGRFRFSNDGLDGYLAEKGI